MHANYDIIPLQKQITVWCILGFNSLAGKKKKISNIIMKQIVNKREKDDWICLLLCPYKIVRLVKRKFWHPEILNNTLWFQDRKETMDCICQDFTMKYSISRRLENVKWTCGHSVRAYFTYELNDRRRTIHLLELTLSIVPCCIRFRFLRQV